MKSYLSMSIVILSFVLAVAILSIKTRGKIWLAYTMFFYACYSLLRWGFFTNNQFIIVYLPIFIFPIGFFAGSALLFYSERVLYKTSQRKITFHLIIPLFALISHILLFIFQPDKMNISSIINQVGFHRTYTIILAAAAVFYLLFLFIITFRGIIHYHKSFKENYSNDLIRSVRWLIYFSLTNMVIIIVKGSVIVVFISQNKGIPFAVAEDYILLFLLIGFIYYLITKPEMLPLESCSTGKSKDKYSKMNLPEKDRVLYAKQLEQYMIQNKAYLEENISIPEISKALDIPQHHLSMTINISFQQNFYSYVNQFRVNHAEGLLKDPKEKAETILMIAYSSGFQSKTSFNKAFKDSNNMTPSEYRRIHLSL